MSGEEHLNATRVRGSTPDAVVVLIVLCIGV